MVGGNVRIVKGPARAQGVERCLQTHWPTDKTDLVMPQRPNTPLTNIMPRTNNSLPRPNDCCRQMTYHIFVLALDCHIFAIEEALKQLNCMPRESSVSAWRCETNKHTSSSHVIHETLISILYTPSCRQQFGGMDPIYSCRRSSKAFC